MATRDVAGEELLFAYGTRWWLARAVEARNAVADAMVDVGLDHLVLPAGWVWVGDDDEIMGGAAEVAVGVGS